MRTFAIRLLTTLAVLAMGTAAIAAGLATGDAAPDFTLKDVSGKDHSLADYKGKYVVLEWTNFGCPFVKKHYSKGSMQALQKKYTEEEVVWLSICSSAPGNQGHMSAEEAQKAITDKATASTAYLIDEEGKVGKLFGARTTPHMFVVDPGGNVVYQGAIDSIRSADSVDIAKADNYVSQCLDACLAGKSSPVSSTKPYGCGVKY